jgi:serine/threonine protein kinase
MQADMGHNNPAQKQCARVTPERYLEIRTLFEAALGVAADRRTEWLRDACKGDSELYMQVDALLVADRLAGEDNSLPQFLPGIQIEPEIPSMEGRRIDNYQVVREIGRGGMGIVYLARRADDLYSKHVALKILRPERRDLELDRRFRLERDIVARLEHPNIARLFDGGTTAEGLPYSVMEYIEGRPIDLYCDENRLNITERLKVFQTICSAVQYAHQNLVVHRDLKPSNILVTAAGTVKLLDFGIAKLIADDLQETQTNLSLNVQVMTPAYASPEQTNGQPINTSSDVYSLGVVLYELVTGRSPYHTSGRLLHEVIRAINEQVPVRPSEIVLRPVEESGRFDPAVRPSPEQISEIREGKPVKLQRRLAGELDNIILMALRKEPQRRYSSVEQLSSDLSRHLAGLPILAQKDTVRYRMGKFVKRHRFGVFSAALVALLMSAAIVGTSRQAHIAQKERNKAEQQAAEAKFQSQRAERETREAEMYRRRAEQEAINARKQLRIAQEQTRQAIAKDREAKLEHERAYKTAQQAHAASAAILEFAGDASSNRAQGSKTAVSAAVQVMTALLSEGIDNPSLRQDLATGRKMAIKLGATGKDINGGAPPGWDFSDYGNYQVGLEMKDGEAGKIVYVRSLRPQVRGFTELKQSIDAQLYKGKRMQLSAMLKSKDVELTGNLFVRIVGKKSEELFNGKSEPSLKGTREWHRHIIVFDVPGDSSEITFGLILQGGGSVWTDKFFFDPVDQNIPTSPAVPKGLLNFNFEDVK